MLSFAQRFIPESLSVEILDPVGCGGLPSLLSGTGMIGQHRSRAHS